ncbi:MAG: hypothetical protein IJS08_14335 [Victivallales bacterium]|nr:hypothetical protein [Victivallales bacterium]
MGNIAFTKYSPSPDNVLDTRLQGARIGDDTFGISIFLLPKNFLIIIWTEDMDKNKIEVFLNAHRELKE